MTHAIPRAGLLLALTGCAQPLHQQYDFGRAYTESLQIQADLSRQSAAQSAYALSGAEGIALRQRATEESTDAESGQAEYVQTFTVQ
jgi:hypothetical protein